MKTRSSVQERLKDLRVERGLNLEELAQETGISKSALGSYENDNDEYKEINHGSLLKLADFYQVSVDYLLGLTNNRKYENTPIEELHLSDEVVELLKSERFNNRLLCEIISHEKFRELLADAEIYVDGIATMHFHDTNSSLLLYGVDTGRTSRSYVRPGNQSIGSLSGRGRRFLLPCDAQNMGRHSPRHTQGARK